MTKSCAPAASPKICLQAIQSGDSDVPKGTGGGAASRPLEIGCRLSEWRRLKIGIGATPGVVDTRSASR
jgi:hypothetical protein